MNTYTLRMPSLVYGGGGALARLPELVRSAKKAVVFTDKGVGSSGLLTLVTAQLDAAGVPWAVLDDLPAEPTCDEAQATAERFWTQGGDVIVAVGGGSVMDAAKLASVLPPELTVRELIDTPAKAQKRVFTIMIPTTAGTGAEATPNSIVALPEKQLKVGIVNSAMIADAVLLDGTMIRDLPLPIAASTGIDALCHAIECYTSKKATPFSDLYALQALRLIFRSLMPACTDRAASGAKDEMLLAAFYAGVAITCSGTTAVHALSYPLGGRYHIPHGVANAMLLAPVMRFNEPACRTRFAQVYDAVGGTGAECEEEKSLWVVRRMEKMVKDLNIPTTLARWNVTEKDLPELVEAGLQVHRLLDNNLRTVSAADAEALYRQLL